MGKKIKLKDPFCAIGNPLSLSFSLSLCARPSTWWKKSWLLTRRNNWGDKRIETLEGYRWAVHRVGLTREIPWLNLVEIDVDHGRAAAGEPDLAAELGREVVADELVVPRVEPEPRWQLRLHHAQEAHRHDLSLSLSNFCCTSLSQAARWERTWIGERERRRGGTI